MRARSRVLVPTLLLFPFTTPLGACHIWRRLSAKFKFLAICCSYPRVSQHHRVNIVPASAPRPTGCLRDEHSVRVPFTTRAERFSVMRRVAVESVFTFVSLPCRLRLHANLARFQLAAPSGCRGGVVFGGGGCIAMWAGRAPRPTSQAYPTVGELRPVAGILGGMCSVILLLQQDALLLGFSPLLPVSMLHAPYTCHGTMLVPSWPAEGVLGPWDELPAMAQCR